MTGKVDKTGTQFNGSTSGVVTVQTIQEKITTQKVNDNESQLTQLSAADSPAIKIFQIQDGVEDKDIPSLLIEVAQDYITKLKGATEFKLHLHGKRPALSIEVPRRRSAKDFLASLPVFAATNINGKRQIRIYRDISRLTDVKFPPQPYPYYYRSQIICVLKDRKEDIHDLSTGISIKKTGEKMVRERSTYTQSTIKIDPAIRSMIEKYESEHGTITKICDLDDIVDFIIQETRKDTDLVGLLRNESYPIPDRLTKRYRNLSTLESKFVTLYFDDLIDLPEANQDSEGILALPKSIFNQALATGDTKFWD